MAEHFIRSLAAGAQNGADWANAWLFAFNDGTPVYGVTRGAPGDWFYVHQDHNDNRIANSWLIFSPSAAAPEDKPTKFVCVTGATTGTAKGALARMRQVGAGECGTSGNQNASHAGVGYAYGLYVTAGTHVIAAGASAGNDDQLLEECDFDSATYGASGDRVGWGGSSQRQHLVRLLRCDLNPQTRNNGLYVSHLGYTLIDLCTLTPKTTIDTAFHGGFPVGTIAEATFRGCDFTSPDVGTTVAGGNFDGNGGYRCICFLGCDMWQEMPPGFGPTSPDHYDQTIEMVHCDNGDDIDPAWQHSKESRAGKVRNRSAIYRQGSEATDNVRPTPYSMEIENASTNYPHLTIPMDGHTLERWYDFDGVSTYRVTIYVMSSMSQYNDDLWFDLHYPNEADASALGALKSSRIADLADTPTILPSDTSTWIGGLGVVQKIEQEITPMKAGWITAELWASGFRGGAQFGYADPVIYVEQV